MNPEKNIDEILDRYITSASKEEVESHCDQVFQQLQSRAQHNALHPRQERIAAFRPVRFLSSRNVRIVAAAAAVLFAVLIGVRWQTPAPAVVANVDGGLYRIVDGKPQPFRVGERLEMGEIIHSNGGSGGTLVLADGSRVEMRTKSELFLERADDGVRIRLGNGGIIVNAAKQRTGHLYVQTKDVTVSVVGTVFLVNAEEEGSRVAVIEGEVHVQQGAMETKLRPGEQVASNPKMETLSVTEEVAWSREAVSHAALLQGAARIPAAQTPKEERVAFEVATIRPSAPLPAPGPNARGGGGGGRALCDPLAVQLDPRRFRIGSASLYELVAMAYGRCEDLRKFDRISGGPESVKSEKWDIEALIPEGSVEPLPTGFNGPGSEFMEGRSPKVQKMLRTLLEERFKLVVRRETKEMPVYVLTVAPGGPNFQGNVMPNIPPGAVFGFMGADGKLMTPAEGASATRINLANRCRGESSGLRECSSAAFSNEFMATPTSAIAGFVERIVVDRTGIQDKVSFSIEWRRTEGYVAGQIPTPPGFQVISKALEAVGLQLKEDPKGQVETFVIARAEKPSEN